MTSYRKNLLVGVVVLFGLIVLGWMILQFGDRGAALFSPARIPITLRSDRADGLGQGAMITYRGVNVGRVVSVTRLAGNTGVVISAVVDETPPLPGNLQGEIFYSSALGSVSSVSLITPGDAEPEGELKANAELEAQFLGLALIPPEITRLANELQAVTRQFRDANVVGNFNETLTTLRAQLEKAGDVLDSVNAVVGDQQMRADIQAAVAHIRQASADAAVMLERAKVASERFDNITAGAETAVTDARTLINRSTAGVDQLTSQLTARLEQSAKILERVESVATKIDRGQGTAGQLVNDPKLYQALVDSTEQLNQTIVILQRIAQQWEQEGVSLRLK